MESIKSSSGVVQSVVSFEDVDYSHPNGTIALRKVNFNITRSELVAVLGANGAGKSTMVRHINGLLKPTHGRVRVFGQDTKFSTPALLSRKVGIVFQNPNNQLFAQSVTKEIEFALKNFGFSDDLLKKKIDWALDTFSLREYAGRSPMELSGGEKKRLCFALVLSWDPEILILDEPTVGQDSEQKEKLDQIIRLLINQKKNVILVTHDVEFVWPLQPRTILMSNGEIVADGSSQDVLSDEMMMKRSSILSPQLIDFAKKMEWSKPYPIDTEDAEQRVLS